MINRNKTKDFPVRLLNKGCFLKTIEYTCGESEKGKWEALKISINKDNMWINERYFNPIKSEYETEEKYQSARLRIARCLEHIASTYLGSGSQEMIDLYSLNKDQTSGKFKRYCDKLVELLEAKNYRTIPVDIKTIMIDGKVRLPFNPFFIKKHDSNITFSYSDYEDKKIKESLNKPE